jgi:hypothetical protein
VTSESEPPDDGFASFVRRAEQIRATDDAWQEHTLRADVERAEEEVRQRQELHADVENVVSATLGGAEEHAVPFPRTRGQYAVALEMWNGQNSAADDLNRAAAAHLAALKNALTPELETALRNLEAGKVSTLATAKIFRSAPHVLEMLSGTPLVQKVRELVQMLNAPSEWEGYLDQFWTLGQTILWIVTRDPWVVDQTSNDSGRLGETWGQIKAAILINTLNLPREHVRDMADGLRRRCLDSRMTAIDGHNRPIRAIEWRHLKIVLDDGNNPFIQRIKQSTMEPATIVRAYEDVVFSRHEVLREFPLSKEPEDSQESDVYAQTLLHQRRKRIADWFNRRTAFGKRIWFSLSETADEYARKPGSLSIDDKERELALDALRRSILAREFADEQGRSRVFSMHPSGLADFRFDPLGARHADLFSPIAPHLWITHQDCVDWFTRHRLDLPVRLRREPPLTVPPAGAHADFEPPAQHKRSELANKTDENKKPNVLEIAKTFVKDGIAPSVRDHATLVMEVLKKDYPGNRPKRVEVEELLATAFVTQRHPRGRTGGAR